MADKDLWCAVLYQAVADALNGAPSEVGSRETRFRMTKEARHYLTTPSDDLATVCAFAGLDPVAVMEHMRKRIAAAPTPEELIGYIPPDQPEPKPKPKPKPEPRPKPEPEPSRTPRKAVRIIYSGKSLTIAKWSQDTGIPLNTLYKRYRAGLQPDEILYTGSLRYKKADPG